MDDRFQRTVCLNCWTKKSGPAILPIRFVISGIRKPPEKLSPLLQQGAPRGSLAPIGEGRGEANRCTGSMILVSRSQIATCSDRKPGTFGPCVPSEQDIRTPRTVQSGANRLERTRSALMTSAGQAGFHIVKKPVGGCFRYAHRVRESWQSAPHR